MSERMVDGYAAVYAREVAGILEEALEALAEHDLNLSEPFDLRFVKETSREDTAHILGLRREQTVSDRVRRAKNFLKAELPPLEDLR
jgi:DNA-directed RNA polymerase specialized sigma24 family protein